VRPFDPRLLRHAGAARGYLAGTIGLGLAGTALILLQAGLLARVLASAARGTGISAAAATLAGLAVVLAGRAAASAGSEVTALRAAAAVKSGLRSQLSAHALRLGPGWLGGQQAGEITTLATRGLDGLDAYFSRYLPQLVLAVAVPLAVLARIAFADWISAVIIAVTLPLIPIFAVLIGLHTKAKTQRQWQLLARLGGHFLDVVAGLPTLKVFGRAKVQAEVIKEVTSAHRAATMATLRVAFLSALVLELAAALATALVAVEVGLRLLAGHLGYQTALLVLLLTPEAYLPLRNVGAQFHASTEGATAAQRAFEILDTPVRGWDGARSGTAGGPAPARAAAGGAPAPLGALAAAGSAPAPAPALAASAPDAAPDLWHEEIRLRAVTLAYPGRDQPALDAISLTIRPGDRITLTGPSGAGKSSLFALLLRSAAPTSGTISAGGSDLADVAADGWLRQIAWVPQRPHLFTRTIAANIALGQPGAPRQEIEAAGRLAGAEDFIGQLPRGYDTVLTEGALRLSAGQRQKIALARAFLRRAPLLLLDEPTAHLDPASAAQLGAAIEAQMAGRTVLLVTHRPPAPADGTSRILALDRGRLIAPAETGTAPGRQAGLAITP
jgi:ATP-binding cassette, subfamily C, bacterial CydD